MSGMCERCFYDVAAPNSDLCGHCRRVAEMEAAATAAAAKAATEAHERKVIEQEEAA